MIGVGPPRDGLEKIAKWSDAAVLVIALLAMLFLLLVFLGYVRSHWIAPGVLFIVAIPPAGELLWNDPAPAIVASLAGLLAFLYLAFGIGWLIAPKKKIRGGLLGRRD